MSEISNQALLVVGHGSRREETNEDVRQAALRIGERGRFPLVVAAFLEIAQPTIAEGFAQLVEGGAKHIIVHSYFLSPGRHIRGDIRVEVRAAASRYSNISYQITEPLAAHPYEEPVKPEVVLSTDQETVEASGQEILKELAKHGLIGETAPMPYQQVVERKSSIVRWAIA